jgi:hypothetical protein
VDFLVAKDDLHRCRFSDDPPSALAPGEVRLAVDSFGLTANNITYAKFGEAMSYWGFFPAEPGWGHMPVWGFAEVIDTQHHAVEIGTRVYGYLPPASDLVLAPAAVNESGFIDAAEHRSELPSAYNRYVSVDSDPIYEPGREDQQMLLRPLFFTSYMIDDLLEDDVLSRASTIVLSSASSKTATALAFLLHQREGVEVIGLTSARAIDFARRIGVYDAVLPYAEIGSLPDGPAAFVDMAGNSDVRSAVHEHYRDGLVHSAVVGATHHDRLGQIPDALPGPRPAFFFAPDRVSKRGKDWGREQFERRLADAWRPYIEWTAGWLEVIHGQGPAILERTYLDLLDGRIDPAQAHVLSL